MSQDIWPWPWGHHRDPACRVGSEHPVSAVGARGSRPRVLGSLPTPLSHLWSQNSHSGREASTSVPPPCSHSAPCPQAPDNPLLHSEACIEHPLHTCLGSAPRGWSSYQRAADHRSPEVTPPLMALPTGFWVVWNERWELSVGAGGRGPEEAGRLPGGGGLEPG